eukprot:SAG22_NODE_797_length_7135_cov_211.841103_10_plen_290_part_00
MQASIASVPLGKCQPRRRKQQISCASQPAATAMAATQPAAERNVHTRDRAAGAAPRRGLVMVSVQVPANLAVSPERAGELISQVVRGFPTHAAALRANRRFGAAEQTLQTAMEGLGYAGAGAGSSSDDESDEPDDDDWVQQHGNVVMPNRYAPPDYPDDYAPGWVYPPPLPTPYPLCCECESGCCVARGTASGQLHDGACCAFLRAECELAMTAGDGNGGYEHVARPPNDVQRFRCYEAVARLLGYTYRQRLPDCVVTTIRSTWPSADGHYTGYRPDNDYTSDSEGDDY